jgi:hypothetical protein
VQIPEQPTQVNVTRAPVTPTPLSTLEVPTASGGNSSSLALAVAVMLIGGLGLVALIIWRRRQ